MSTEFRRDEPPEGGFFVSGSNTGGGDLPASAKSTLPTIQTQCRKGK